MLIAFLLRLVTLCFGRVQRDLIFLPRTQWALLQKLLQQAHNHNSNATTPWHAGVIVDYFAMDDERSVTQHHKKNPQQRKMQGHKHNILKAHQTDLPIKLNKSPKNGSCSSTHIQNSGAMPYARLQEGDGQTLAVESKGGKLEALYVIK